MANLSLRIDDIIHLVSGELVQGEGDKRIDGVQTLAKASGSQASFLSNMKYKNELSCSQAGLVLMSEGSIIPDDASYAVIQMSNPYLGFTMLQRFFYPAPISSGHHHATAVVDVSAKISESVQLDAHVCIAEGVEIGSGTIIGAGCVIAKDVFIGSDCLIHPRVVLEKGTVLGNRVIIQPGAVLGADGFGFAWTGDEYLKIPQVGRVVIEDDVEIGANTCIDRGAIEDTVIRSGVKLDNLIQIGHNVEVGEKTVLAGQVGISGSTVIGEKCQLGGQAGVAGHLTLADGCVVGAKAGVIGDITEAGMVSGFPAVPHRHWLKASALFDRLPTIWNKIKRLSE